MDKSKFIIRLILLSSILVSGCGGGGGSGSGSGGGETIIPEPPPPTSFVSVITGVVSDGPIRNARVFLDINYNGKFEDGEPFCITNEKGEYKIEYILDSGTDYLLIVEGSPALGTEDPADNPGTPLEFVMFMKVTAVGARNSDPVAATYRQDVSPFIFRDYLRAIDAQLGGIADPYVRKILDNNSGSQPTLFRDAIIINPSQGIHQNTLAQFAELFRSFDDNHYLQQTKNELLLASASAVGFSDKDLQSLGESLANRNRLVSKIGDLVVSRPLNAATTDPVAITNMKSAEAAPKVTMQLYPGSLPAYAVSITEYRSLLEIPNFAELRNRGHSVVLGADITARASDGTKVTTQALSSFVEVKSGSASDLEYLYFNGAVWVAGNPVAANMSLRTAPFVLVKKNSLVQKSLTIEGLSLFDNPTVLVKGYAASDGTQTSVLLDAFPVSPASDTVTINIPGNFIVHEIVVVDEEIGRVSADRNASLSIAVADSVSNGTISASLTSFIVDGDLRATLADGNQVIHDFPGFAPYLDTRVPYRGIDMFLGLEIDAATKALITENINRFLTHASPVFYSGSGNYAGVTIDVPNSTIRLGLVETVGSNVSDIALTYGFEKNKITRTFEKICTGGGKQGSKESSTYTFSMGFSLMTVLFEETIAETYLASSGYSQSLLASYEGTAIYENNGDWSLKRLAGAKFHQKHQETNSVTNQTNSVNGLVTMYESVEGGGVDALSFTGDYSLYLPLYGTVAGRITLSDAWCAEGYTELDRTYFNNNSLNSAQVLFASETENSMIPANPLWARGTWRGTFSDSCSGDSGDLTIIVNERTASWWGQSSDANRIYGTSVEVKDAVVQLMDGSSMWGEGTKISDTRITGTWSFGGCTGTFDLTKP